jgi:hypothetical protein
MTSVCKQQVSFRYDSVFNFGYILRIIWIEKLIDSYVFMRYLKQQQQQQNRNKNIMP